MLLFLESTPVIFGSDARHFLEVTPVIFRNDVRTNFPGVTHLHISAKIPPGFRLVSAWFLCFSISLSMRCTVLTPGSLGQTTPLLRLFYGRKISYRLVFHSSFLPMHINILLPTALLFNVQMIQ